MINRRILLLSLVALVLASVGSGWYVYQQMCPDLSEVQVRTDTATFTVGLATTDVERQRGLMYCPYVPTDRGLYFILAEPGRPSFWMKNMRIPLDIIWINNDTIIGIERNVPPADPGQPIEYYQPPQVVTAVLEVSAGAAAQLQPGMKAQLLQQ